MEQLAYPNGMTRDNTYEDSRDLLSVKMCIRDRDFGGSSSRVTETLFGQKSKIN